MHRSPSEDVPPVGQVLCSLVVLKDSVFLSPLLSREIHEQLSGSVLGRHVSQLCEETKKRHNDVN